MKDVIYSFLAVFRDKDVGVTVIHFIVLQRNNDLALSNYCSFLIRNAFICHSSENLTSVFCG